jgi:hypothetical protein
MNYQSIDWNDVINKDARGSNDEDLGEVQEVEENYILVQRGMISKDKFYIPIDMVESYDGNICVLIYLKNMQQQNVLETRLNQFIV